MSTRYNIQRPKTRDKKVFLRRAHTHTHKEALGSSYLHGAWWHLFLVGCRFFTLRRRLRLSQAKSNVSGPKSKCTLCDNKNLLHTVGYITSRLGFICLCLYCIRLMRCVPVKHQLDKNVKGLFTYCFSVQSRRRRLRLVEASGL